MKNIFLVGMPGSGKSTLGKRLAEMLHREHFDTDEKITDNEGMTPEDIILVHGEEKLRSLEHELLMILLNKENLVISTGGGFPVFNSNMVLMNEKSITVYLKYPPEILWKRLKKDRVRPLSPSLPSLSVLLEKRAEVYEKAQIVVTGEEEINENIANVIRAISELLPDENPEKL